MAVERNRRERVRSFFDRFVHPWLAGVATLAVSAWGLSFLVAASGLAAQATDRSMLAFMLFFTSGLVGAAGTATLVACALYLVGLWGYRVANDVRA